MRDPNFFKSKNNKDMIIKDEEIISSNKDFLNKTDDDGKKDELSEFLERRECDGQFASPSNKTRNPDVYKPTDIAKFLKTAKK